VDDLVDQFERVRSLCDGEKEFLHGALDIYQSRTDTKMNYAMERLAVLAVVTLPITALASVYGMNVIVNDHTDFPHLAVVLLVMVTISATLLRWARRQGWW
jgi:Mg2+ and Co2+ transporter CorA